MINYFHPQRQLVDQLDQHALSGHKGARELSDLWFKLVELEEPDAQMEQHLRRALAQVENERQ